MKYGIKQKWIAWLVMLGMVFSIVTPAVGVKAEATADEMTVSLRVEGPEKTILQKSIPLSSDQITVYDALTTMLDQQLIPYNVATGNYINSINNLNAGTYSSNAGWLYKIVRDGKLEASTNDLGMDQFILQPKDEIIIYYGEWGIPFAGLTLDNTEVDPGKVITATVVDLSTDSQEPIVGATVYFGEQKIITDNHGKASFTPEDTVTLSVYAEQIDNQLPLIVRSKKAEVQVTDTKKSALNNAINKLLGYYRKQGVPNSEWVVFGLNALGEDVNRTPYATEMQSYAPQNLVGREIQNGKSTSIGDISKTIVAIKSLGYDPENFAGKDFVKQLQDQTDYSLLHQALFGLIALDAAAATDLADVNLTRDKLINKILESNRVENGWGFGSSLDTDTTAMAMYALAPHQDRDDVKQAINDGVKALQKLQQADGGFKNSSSTIEAIQALTMVGVDPQGEQFTTESGHNPVTNLFTYQLDNGAFAYLPGQTRVNNMSTEKALIALAALQQFSADKPSVVYTDIHYAGETPPPLPEKPFSVKASPLERQGGLLTRANIWLNFKEHPEPVFIVFQLIKDQEPISMVAIKEKITSTKEVTAFFNAVNDPAYKVNIIVLDQLTDPENIGITLSHLVIAQ